MFIAMNRFRVTKGCEASFEQVWLSRDTHLDQVLGFVEFHLLKGPKPKIIRCMRLTRCGRTALFSKHGPDLKHSVPRIIELVKTSRSISGTRNSRGSKFSRPWDLARHPDLRQRTKTRW